MVGNICEGLIAVDPDHADYYLENKNRYLQDLNDLDAYIHRILDNFANRYFMIYHPSFGYFADEYDLTQLAIEHGGKPPTPKVIQACIDLAKQFNLSYIFVAPQSETRHAETIAHSIGGETLSLDPLPQHYIPHMRSVADSLSSEME